MSANIRSRSRIPITGNSKISIATICSGRMVIGFAAQILTPQADQLAALIEAERSMHSHLHITDPTLYRKAIHSDGLRQQVDLAKAALAFILAVQKVKTELAPAKQEGN